MGTEYLVEVAIFVVSIHTELRLSFHSQAGQMTGLAYDCCSSWRVGMAAAGDAARPRVEIRDGGWKQLRAGCVSCRGVEVVAVEHL